MKKILICLLSVMLVMQLCGCNQATPSSGTQAISQTKTCPSCGQASNSAFCPNCGTQITSNIACSACGTQNESSSQFCGACGAKLQSSPAATFTPGGQSTPAPTDDVMGSAECLECAYSGLDYCQGHECLLCEGVGYSECYAGCNGGCSFCDGGYIDCSCDNGRVYFSGGTSYVPTSESQACSYCENGYVTCSLCGGSGRHGSYTTGGFDGTPGAEVETTCNRCFGAKKISCSYCGGDGEL